ncbi:MAG TPA: tetraacyldisaccharide 4'-kinase, partial [Thermoanaerobaculia bacterium]|nr:tetraacyldisaccharide 4'-kinase [Thermoanaerobaculia bacterium]
RSDIYALGVVGYLAVSGRLPFETSNLPALLFKQATEPAPGVLRVAPGLPPALAAAIDRCLVRDPAGRFPDGEALAAALAPHGFRGPGFASATSAAPPVLADGRALAPGTRVLLVAGIARPQRFAASARGTGLEIAGERFYPDHHPYPAESLEEIRRAAAAAGAEAVLATAKDGVKLRGRLALPLAELPVRAVPEPAFWRWLDGEVTALLDGDAEALRGGAATRRDTGC